MEVSIKLVRDEESKQIRPKAKERAEERLLDLLLLTAPPGLLGPPARPRGSQSAQDSQPMAIPARSCASCSQEGKLDDREVEVEMIAEDSGPFLQIFGGAGVEEMGLGGLKDMLGSFGKKTKRRKLKSPSGPDCTHRPRESKSSSTTTP